MKKSLRFPLVAFAIVALFAITLSGCAVSGNASTSSEPSPSPTTSSSVTIFTVDPSEISDYEGVWTYRATTLSIDASGNVKETLDNTNYGIPIHEYSGSIMQLGNGTCIWNSENDGAHNVMLDKSKTHIIVVGQSGAQTAFKRQ